MTWSVVNNKHGWFPSGGSWNNGDTTGTTTMSLSVTGVTAGSTLVLVLWDYVGGGGANYGTPADSNGTMVAQSTLVANTNVMSQLKIWTQQNAAAGTHTITLANPSGFADGECFFAEFKNTDGTPSGIFGNAQLDSWNNTFQTSGAVQIATAPVAGDALIYVCMMEESTTGDATLNFTDPPSGFTSLGVVQDSTLRIGGEWCWKVAPDTTRPTVTWTWDNNPGQTNLVQAVVIGLTAPSPPPPLPATLGQFDPHMRLAAWF
jgi:hypothetical protein